MDTPKPFGWWIESKDMRWFTQEESRVNYWRNMKGVTILALGIVPEQLEAVEEPTPSKQPVCDHEPDVLKRCVKCGEDLSLQGMMTPGKRKPLT